ncbi:hypothetical protein [Bacillus sp. FJAT-29814]|uniref:hypothetical protein n=1 Tax=Bacillus sp. FJAT-29814 TaxID=1729688 RepID=UPI000832405D|nr:hypothetical protein [Bacillus sp. FJAT-29814]
MKQLLKDQVFFKLDELMTRKVIKAQISRFDNSPYWYKVSYKPFIGKFDETRGNSSIDAWAERVACIYSWLPKIPLKSFKLEQNFLQETLNILTELESIYYDAELETIGTTSYHGYKYHGETIFPSYKGYYDTSIREFLQPSGFLLHQEPNLDTQLSSTTKLLHFMCPNLFPIFDTKVCKQLFNTTRKTFERYHAYVFGLQKFLQEGESAPYINTIANQMDLSPLYIIDFVIFNMNDQ